MPFDELGCNITFTDNSLTTSLMEYNFIDYFSVSSGLM